MNLPQTKDEIRPMNKGKLYNLLNDLSRAMVHYEIIEAIKAFRQVSDEEAKNVQKLLIPEVYTVLVNLGYMEEKKPA